MNKEVKNLIKILETNGWRTRQGRRSHIMCFSPDGKGKILLSATPSDTYFLSNVKRDLKKCGYEKLAEQFEK